MADENRDARGALTRRLVEEGHRFSFFQAVRLIERLRPDAARVGHQGPVAREAVRFRPALDFSFAAADIASIEETPAGGFEMTTTFLGLYGAVSPLPSYFTEQLLEQDDESLLREFVDLFHHRLISLFYRTWEKYRFAAGFEPGGLDGGSRRLLGLLAVDPERLPAGHRVPAVRLLGLAGPLTQVPRSAGSIRAALAEHLEGVPVDVESFVGRWIGVPDDQRARLGRANARLGRDLTVGDRVFDRGCTFRVALGPLGIDDFLSFLPGGGRVQELREIVDLVNGDGLDYEVELSLRAEETPPVRLGVEPARLGWCSWLGKPERSDNRVRFLVKGWFHGGSQS
ncbi:MAG TPA: type VI secretion system baseplate subunit TssG [Planctomycetota bacterium]